ncbi:MAG: alpha/beta hydrolase [Planctomycetaceae bacterium]
MGHQLIAPACVPRSARIVTFAMPFTGVTNRVRRFAAKRWLRSTASILALGAVGLNAWAVRHSWTMTHFSDDDAATPPPERLSAMGKVRVLVAGVNVLRPANRRTPGALDLAFETRHVDSSDGHVLEAWYVPRPGARAIVTIFHGYHSAKSSLLESAQAFHELGCAVLLVDFRGCGGSTGNTTTLGIHEADDVAAACSLAHELAPDTPLVLYGHSMGSAAILRAIALEKILPEAVILECTFDRLLTTVEHRFGAMGLPSFPFARLLVFWGGALIGTNAFTHNPADYATRARCPALVLHGEQDPRVSLAEARAVCESLAGENRLEVFADVGHESCCRARPRLWRQVVGAFLERCAD